MTERCENTLAEHRLDRVAGAKQVQFNDAADGYPRTGKPTDHDGHWHRRGLGGPVGLPAAEYSDEPEYDESDDGEPDYRDSDYVPGQDEVPLADGVAEAVGLEPTVTLARHNDCQVPPAV